MAKCIDGFAGLSYWINTYVKIQDRKSKKDVKFALWPGQEKVIPFFLEEQYLVVLKARQLGLTWLCAAYALWRAIFNYYELIIIISAREDLAIEFLERVKFMFDRLPKWMTPPAYKRSTTELSFGYEIKDAQNNIELKGLNSTIKSLPATPDAGQSKTISLLIMDESALNRYCREIWAAASPTLEHAAGKTVILSNPSKNRPGWPWTRDLYTNSMKGMNTFKRIFLSWNEVPGRGVDFLQRKAAEEGLDDEDLSMQYPSTEDEAISVLGGSYFGKSLAGWIPEKGDRGYLSLVDGEYVFIHDIKGEIEVWNEPDNSYKQRYSIGSDVSEGLGESYSVAYVYDRMEKKYAARMRSNRIDADVWAQRLIELGNYYGGAMIGVERNGAGITTIIHLQDNYQNLFFRRKPGKMKGQYVLEYGWTETQENKQILADELKRHFRLVFSSVPCGVLLDEASTFIRHENGKIGHEEGKYDDCVISAGLTIQVALLMEEVEVPRIEKRQSRWDRRLDELEAGEQDDFEAFVQGNVPLYQDL